jgi:hypothetical protein
LLEEWDAGASTGKLTAPLLSESTAVEFIDGCEWDNIIISTPTGPIYL